MRKLTLVMNAGVLAVLVLLVASVSAQGPNPRYGKWKLKSDAPPPNSNVMTYEPISGTVNEITKQMTARRGATTAR